LKTCRWWIKSHYFRNFVDNNWIKIWSRSRKYSSFDRKQPLPWL